MLDLRRIRTEPDLVRECLERRAPGTSAPVDEILRLDEVRRDGLGALNELRAERNQVSKRVGELKRSGAPADELVAAMRGVNDRIAALEEAVRDAETRIEQILLRTPNLPDPAIPDGGEGDAVVCSTWGARPEFGFDPLPHWEVGERTGVLDLAAGSKISGSGFPVLRGRGARLQRGLINYFLDVHTSEHGYEEVRVPYLVHRDTMIGTGQLPKFEEESYLVAKDELWLVPTAEVPVTNLHRDELLAMEDLPKRMTAYSPCFRREAGAAGKDTRGLLRVHQFDKVELVRYELPERSHEALEELTREAEVLLERLGLHHRRILLAAGDLGFSGSKTYDLEVWAPGVGRWLEVSSCTNFTDYQARRSNIRFRRSQADRPEFVHTLNGSALALPRIVAALLETYQNPDGGVSLPEVIHAYVGCDRLDVLG